MNKNHLKKISLLFVVAAVFMVIVSSVPLSPGQAHSASPGLRIVYGRVNGDGTILDGSGDFTATFLGKNLGGYPIWPNNDKEYQINFGAATGFTSPPSVVAQIANQTFHAGTAVVETPTTSGVKIRIGRVGEQLLGDNGFSFIAVGQSSSPSSGINVAFGKINGGRGGGVPGAMIDPGSGGWSSYFSGGSYHVNFGSGIFTQNPIIVLGPDIGAPVDCLTFNGVSTAGFTFDNFSYYCLDWPYYSWGGVNFIAVGAGAKPLANLAIAQGTWTRSGGLNAGSTGILSVTSGAEWWSPNGYTVNFNSGFFAQNPIVITTASYSNLAPMLCSEAYNASPFSTTIHFTGGSDGFTDTCTYGDGKSGAGDFAHYTAGATMIAVGVSPIRPLLASCSVVNGSIPYGTSAQFSASASGGAAGTYSYLWNYPAGLASCGDAASCSTNRLNSSLAPGAFNVTVTDSNGSQSNIAECPGVNVSQPSVVAASFSGTVSQLTFSVTTPVNVTTSAKIYVRNIGPASSTMDWSCAVDPSYVLPPGLTVDTSTSQCSGFGLRGGAPPF